MPIEYPGAIYHVMNRGDRRDALFKDDHEPELFLTRLDEACGKTRWQFPVWPILAVFRVNPEDSAVRIGPEAN